MNLKNKTFEIHGTNFLGRYENICSGDFDGKSPEHKRFFIFHKKRCPMNLEKKTLEIYWTKFSWKTMLSNEFNSKHRCQKNMSIAAKGPVVVAFGNKGA